MFEFHKTSRVLPSSPCSTTSPGMYHHQANPPKQDLALQPPSTTAALSRKRMKIKRNKEKHMIPVVVWGAAESVRVGDCRRRSPSEVGTRASLLVLIVLPLLRLSSLSSVGIVSALRVCARRSSHVKPLSFKPSSFSMRCHRRHRRRRRVYAILQVIIHNKQARMGHEKR